MIIPIFIDYSEIADQYASLDREAIDRICDNVAKTLAARYAQQLEIEATNALHQTRKRYIQAINVIDSGKMEGTVILDFSKDPMVRMIEEGASAFDMKSGLLNSPKAKVSKNGGRYITVPFRFANPEAVAGSDVFSNIMPLGVYEVAKEQPVSIPIAGGTRSQGLTTAQLPVQYQKPATRAVITDSKGKMLFDAYTHKSSIYTGMIKTTDNKTGQNSYGSFRRVSETLISPEGKQVGSDPNSWINKGIEQYNLVGKALNNFNREQEVQMALNAEFEKLNMM